MLMKCFKAFFRCIMQMGDASGSISLPLTAHTVPSQPTLTLKLYTKCQSFWYPLSMANGMICYKERHPLFMECFQTILRCTRQMRGASHSICLQLMGLIVPFSTVPKPTLKLHPKYQILVPAQYGRWEAKGMLYHTETQPLLMKCFKTILSCTIQMKEASDSFCKPHMGLTVPISTFINSQIAHKTPYFR